MSAGYSTTPLAKKLGIQEGLLVGVQDAPDGIEETLDPLPPGARLTPAARARELDLILLFVRRPRDLERRLPSMLGRMGPDSALWICWAKKSSPLATEVDEAAVRGAGLAAGVVDVKICAVDEDWSGLKFVFRLADRPARSRTRAVKK